MKGAAVFVARCRRPVLSEYQDDVHKLPLNTTSPAPAATLRLAPSGCKQPSIRAPNASGPQPLVHVAAPPAAQCRNGNNNMQACHSACTRSVDEPAQGSTLSTLVTEVKAALLPTDSTFSASPFLPKTCQPALAGMCHGSFAARPPGAPATTWQGVCTHLASRSPG